MFCCCCWLFCCCWCWSGAGGAGCEAALMLLMLLLSRAGFCVASVGLLAAADWLLKGVVDERRKVLVPFERALEMW